MILLSTSSSVRKAFHIARIETTPSVPTDDWYRYWRIDARKNKSLGEVMLFTNQETLYTLVCDSREFKRGSDVIMCFLFRYGELFNGHFGYNGRIKEDLMVHKAVNLSVAGVMNGIFQRIDFLADRYSHKEIEVMINEIPVVSRGIVPFDYFNRKLNENH